MLHVESQWAEDEKLEETLEQRRMERYSFQAEVMQKAPELVVHERMPQGKGVKCTKEKKKVKGHRRNAKIERYESGRDGSMLEEFG